MRTHVTSLEDGGLTKAYQIAHDANTPSCMACQTLQRPDPRLPRHQLHQHQCPTLQLLRPPRGTAIIPLGRDRNLEGPFLSRLVADWPRRAETPAQ